MGQYLSSSRAQQQEMLDALGLASAQDLFKDVPAEVRLNKPLNIPAGKSEMAVRRFMQALADKNTVFDTVLRGAGAYDHFIPAIVPAIVGKEEFSTTYTPYQAEISQGVLQAIFEFQTYICELTGMDAANASMYDGASSAAEAAMMCLDRRRDTVVVSATTHPDTIETIRTYCWGRNVPFVVAPEKDGVTDLDALKALMGDKTACVYLQQPNFYGQIEDAQAIGEITHAQKAKFIMGVNPVSVALIKSPAEYGADIAVGEGQPLGMPLSYGGPYLGFMACKQELTRMLPGRIAGQTVDNRGQRCFVLTLQAREQHIRREKAGSNVCSNQALCALTASVYLAAMGPQGFRQVAESSYHKAHYLAEQLTTLPKVSLAYHGPFFHEFVTVTPGKARAIEQALADKGVLSGLPLDDDRVLWCVTEKAERETLDEVVSWVGEVLK